MSPITTHILDTAIGKPAAGINIDLFIQNDNEWEKVGSGTTDNDGRVKDLMSVGELKAGTYKIKFYVGSYFAKSGTSGFYNEIPIEFCIKETSSHYHVPLLLNPFGYSTYRGS